MDDTLAFYSIDVVEVLLGSSLSNFRFFVNFKLISEIMILLVYYLIISGQPHPQSDYC